MTKSKLATLVWIDLEMTGLDAENDYIMEVAAIATDWDFNELDIYEGVIKNEEANLEERMKMNSVFWDVNIESRQSLKEQNKKGKDLLEIEDELIQFVDNNFEKDQQVILSGNSIHVDRRFIMEHWPRLDSRLHYRMLDVSAWKVVFEGKYGKKFPKPQSHRALNDIRGSIMELKYYIKKVHA